ncbi:MAG: hypothetical protein ACE14L_05770 [Terriglobales bacterium]
MKRIVPIIVIVLTVAFLALGSVQVRHPRPTTPDGAVQAMFADVKTRDWNRAFNYVANAGQIEREDFIGDLQGRHGSLRNYSSLERVDTSVLHQNASEAMVRVNLGYSSAVGALEDTRDLKVVREDNEWKVVWPVRKEPKAPPQVVPVNFLRWDVVYRGADDDWGAQDVAPPKVRITSMNAIEHQGRVIVLGEIVNDDTVPGFVSIGAALIGQNGEVMGEETAFDKIMHTLLPKEVSPFRIDFPGVKLADVKSVRMAPNSMLVPASADPVIGAIHQRITKDSRGNTQLTGELVNQSGQTVNIPHVLATFYDNSGKVIWVSDGYVDRALPPQTPQPFAVNIANEIAPRVQSYRVTVNQFSWDRREN